jgi:HlyD family secretion protein
MNVSSRRFPWLWSLILLLLGSGVFGLAFLLGQSAVRLPQAGDSGETTRGDRTPGLVCLGYVDLENGVTSLGPLQPGRIEKILVKETDSVKAGTVLLRMEDASARHRVEELQAALAAARNQQELAGREEQTHKERLVQQQAVVDAMGERLAAARSLLDRKEELRKINQANPQDVLAAEHQVKEVLLLEKAEGGKLAELRLRDPRLDLRQAETQVAVMDARLKQARDALAECSLKAPEDGTVLRILANPGDVIGGPGRQAVVLFAGEGPRLVRAEVEQEFVRRLAVNQSARIVDDLDSSRTWTGRVVRISDWYTQRRAILQEAPTLHDVRTVECLIALDQGQPQPRLGLRVEITIRSGTERGE